MSNSWQDFTLVSYTLCLFLHFDMEWPAFLHLAFDFSNNIIIIIEQSFFLKWSCNVCIFTLKKYQYIHMEVELIMFSLLNHNEDHFWIIVHGNGIELSFLECNEKQIKTEKWEHYKHVFNENNYWNRQFYFHSEYCANWSTLLYTSV